MLWRMFSQQNTLVFFSESLPFSKRWNPDEKIFRHTSPSHFLIACLSLACSAEIVSTWMRRNLSSMPWSSFPYFSILIYCFNSLKFRLMLLRLSLRCSSLIDLFRFSWRGSSFFWGIRLMDIEIYIYRKYKTESSKEAQLIELKIWRKAHSWQPWDLTISQKKVMLK